MFRALALISVIDGKEKELRDGGYDVVVETKGKEAAEGSQRSGNCARMFATYNVVREQWRRQR